MSSVSSQSSLLAPALMIDVPTQEHTGPTLPASGTRPLMNQASFVVTLINLTNPTQGPQHRVEMNYNSTDWLANPPFNLIANNTYLIIASIHLPNQAPTTVSKVFQSKP